MHMRVLLQRAQRRCSVVAHMFRRSADAERGAVSHTRFEDRRDGRRWATQRAPSWKLKLQGGALTGHLNVSRSCVHMYTRPRDSPKRPSSTRRSSRRHSQIALRVQPPEPRPPCAFSYSRCPPGFVPRPPDCCAWRAKRSRPSASTSMGSGARCRVLLSQSLHAHGGDSDREGQRRARRFGGRYGGCHGCMCCWSLPGQGRPGRRLPPQVVDGTDRLLAWRDGATL